MTPGPTLEDLCSLLAAPEILGARPGADEPFQISSLPLAWFHHALYERYAAELDLDDERWSGEVTARYIHDELLPAGAEPRDEHV